MYLLYDYYYVMIIIMSCLLFAISATLTLDLTDIFYKGVGIDIF